MALLKPAALAVFLLVLATGCGGGGGGGGSGGSGSGSPAPSPPSEPVPAPRQWDSVAAPVLTTPDGNSPFGVQLTNDATGTATAVVQQGYGVVYASRRAAASAAWSTPVKIAAPHDRISVVAPQAVASPQGDVLVTWLEQGSELGGNATKLMFNRFDAASQRWLGATAFVATGRSPEAAPSLAVDAAGIVTAVTYDNFNRSLWATRYDPAGGSWGTPQLITTANAPTLGVPNLAADRHGNVLAVWPQTSDGRGLYAARYERVSGRWGTPHNLDPDGSTFDEAVAADPAGGFVLAWRRSAGVGAERIAAARLADGAVTWSAAQVLSAGGQSALGIPALAISPNGAATVAYSHQGGISTLRAVSGSAAWGPAQTILPGVQASERPTLSTDAAGNLTMVFVDDISVRALRYLAAGGQWQTPAEAVTLGSGIKRAGYSWTLPAQVADPAGGVTAVWNQAPASGADTGGTVVSKRLR